MGGGGVWQMLTSSKGGGSLNADRGEGKIFQNLADVICERSHIETQFKVDSPISI